MSRVRMSMLKIVSAYSVLNGCAQLDWVVLFNGGVVNGLLEPTDHLCHVEAELLGTHVDTGFQAVVGHLQVALLNPLGDASLLEVGFTAVGVIYSLLHVTVCLGLIAVSIVVSSQSRLVMDRFLFIQGVGLPKQL